MYRLTAIVVWVQEQLKINTHKNKDLKNKNDRELMTFVNLDGLSLLLHE